MAKFEIAYGLGGGFGGCRDWEVIEAKNLEEAEQIAYEYARQEYESYEGYHGLRDIPDIIEEEGVDEETANEIYEEEIDMWLCYKVREVK